ncbi:MAG TPA: carbohydrate ABC transporter permease [Chloroflexi bacterium]|nr:carbohydrate ABC transporter permease [Chloroflexota bacterium]
MTTREFAYSRRRSPWTRWLRSGFVYTFLLIVALLVGIPFIYMVTGSFKLNAEIYRYPVTILPQAPTLENYARLLSGKEIPYLRQFGNSLFVATTQTLLTLSVSALVGWGFAKYEFRGKRILFFFVLLTLMLPFQMTLIPLFLMMVRIGWLDNYLAILLPGAISAFGVFFMRQSMLAIPNELIDAARIDGANDFRIFWQIGLPLVRGALAVLAVLVYLGAWNDYLWPVIVLRTPTQFTYPIGLATLVGLYKVEYGMILAGAFIATLPILIIFIAGRNLLLNNLTIGAIKG